MLSSMAASSNPSSLTSRPASRSARTLRPRVFATTSRHTESTSETTPSSSSRARPPTDTSNPSTHSCGSALTTASFSACNVRQSSPTSTSSFCPARHAVTCMLLFSFPVCCATRVLGVCVGWIRARRLEQDVRVVFETGWGRERGRLRLLVFCCFCQRDTAGELRRQGGGRKLSRVTGGGRKFCARLVLQEEGDAAQLCWKPCHFHAVVRDCHTK